MTLGEVASTLLDGFAEQLKTAGVEVPERQYVAPGSLIPDDGEQLVVVLQAIDQGSPGKPFPDTFVPGSEVFMATFAVAITRIIPALSTEGSVEQMMPSAEELNTAGLEGVADAEGLKTAAVAIHKAHLVTEGGLMGFAIGPCSTVGPEGGMAGARLLLGVNYD